MSRLITSNDVREMALAVVEALDPSAVGEVLRVFRESDDASTSAEALKAREGRKVIRDKDVQCKDIDDAFVVALAQIWGQSSHMGTPGIVESLVATGIPEKLAYAKVERLVRRGFLDYGTSPNYAWPTGMGLAFLRERGAER